MADPGPTNRGRTLRLLAEFITITFGVLVALVGEAWWESRKEAVREQENLAVLASDLLSTDTTLVRVIREDSTFAAMLTEDLVALATQDPEHVLTLQLSVSDYRTRTGALSRAVSDPGPTLEESPELLSLLSDLQAEIRLVENLTNATTEDLFEHVETVIRAQEQTRASVDRLDAAALLAGFGSSPDALAAITMVTVILQNRDNLHRRLLELVRRARAGLAEQGLALEALPESVPDPAEGLALDSAQVPEATAPDSLRGADSTGADSLGDAGSTESGLTESGSTGTR